MTQSNTHTTTAAKMTNMQIAENVRDHMEAQDGCEYTWTGKMTAAQQREMFGQYLGKGTILIDYREGEIDHIVRTCFGTNGETTKRISFWNE